FPCVKILVEKLLTVGWNRGRWLLLALGTCKEKDQNNSEKCCDISTVTKPSFLLRHNTAHGRLPLSQDCLTRIRLQCAIYFRLTDQFAGKHCKVASLLKQRRVPAASGECGAREN